MTMRLLNEKGSYHHMLGLLLEYSAPRNLRASLLRSLFVARSTARIKNMTNGNKHTNTQPSANSQLRLAYSGELQSMSVDLVSTRQVPMNRQSNHEKDAFTSTVKLKMSMLVKERIHVEVPKSSLFSFLLRNETTLRLSSFCLKLLDSVRTRSLLAELTF